MRVLMCGSGDLGIDTLEAVLAAGHEIVGVVTQPPRPAGRGGHMRPTPLSEAARSKGLKVLELPKINAPDAVEALAALQPEVMVVADFGQMVRAAARATSPRGAFNLHASLLPELRGAAPINWAILRGYTKTGVTVFSLVDALDAGDVYVRMSTDISLGETAPELRRRLAGVGAQAVCETLRQVAEGTAKPQTQDESRVTLAPRLSKTDGVISWSADAASVRNLIHGTWPWPGAQTVFCGQQHKDVKAVIARAEALPQAATVHPGTIDAELTVATGSGRLRIVEIKPSGKRLMSWRDFVNGYRVAAGDRFL